MKAMLRTFVMLCLAPLLFLLGGLPALLHTGQVDPGAWAWPALALIPIAFALSIWRGSLHAVWAGVGSFGVMLLFLLLASGRWPAPPALVFPGIILLLAIVSGLLLARRLGPGLLLGAVAILSCWLSAERPVARTPGPRPVVTVISALPLFWREGVDGTEARADAPIIAVLRQRFDIRPIDSPLSPLMREASLLFLAQPRALSPGELIALDAWVRRGGHMLILADPLLRWPSPLPLGDRRRAPAVNMLDPLFRRWGVELLQPTGAGEDRRMLSDQRLLTTMAASTFHAHHGSACQIEENGLFARCTLERGKALLVADADLIDDRLWLADADASLDMRQWTADTPSLIIQELGGGRLAARSWLRSMEQLIVALRYAMVAGIVWALLGSLFLRSRHAGFAPQLGRATLSERLELK